MCACWGQVALRGLSGFLSLEQIWIILPPCEKEIYLEVMAAIPKAKYWFKPNDIYFWTMTQNSEPKLLFSGVPQELMITVSDYSLPQPYQSAFPSQLLLLWNHIARKVVKALGLFWVSQSPAYQQVGVMAICHSNNYGNLYSPISAC